MSLLENFIINAKNNNACVDSVIVEQNGQVRL